MDCYAIVPYSLNNPFTDVKKLAQRVIHVAGKDFVFDQPSEGSTDPSSAGFGARIFNCEIVLAHFLSEHADLVAGRACIELGAGLCLGAMVAAACGAAPAVATDGDESVLEAATRVLSSNGFDGTVFLRRLLWGDVPAATSVLEDIVARRRTTIPSSSRQAIIIAADIVAAPYAQHFEALVRSFVLLSSEHSVGGSDATGEETPGGVDELLRPGMDDRPQSNPPSIVLVYERRHIDELAFFRLMLGDAGGAQAIAEEVGLPWEVSSLRMKAECEKCTSSGTYLGTAAVATDAAISSSRLQQHSSPLSLLESAAAEELRADNLVLESRFPVLGPFTAEVAPLHVIHSDFRSALRPLRIILFWRRS